ncbi:MAG: hypothetical protein LBN26_05610 [Christensenellaceae bacterium]|jgi:hypothetical protein|nr:hypothetical protein [Christensenellaceae bacterium]
MFDFHIDGAALIEVLPLLGKGILGVFLVICAIWAFVWALNKITAPKA